MTNSERVNYIITDFNMKKRAKLASLLEKDTINSFGKLTREEIESFPLENEPDENIRFNYTYQELVEIYSGCEFEQVLPMDDYLLIAAQYCGVHVTEETLPYVKQIYGFSKGTRFYRISGVVDEKRVSMRVIPEVWGKRDERYNTRFIVDGTGIWIDGYLIAEIELVFTGSSVRNLGYLSYNPEGERVLSLNPHQICIQNCRFCLKGLRLIEDYAKDELIMLSAEEMCRYLFIQFADLDYSTINEIMILTGRFATASQVVTFMKKMKVGLLHGTGGMFDPDKNKNQRLKVSTHILFSDSELLELKEIGIKRYVYPIEIFNDIFRQKYMTSKFYPQGNNKGDILIHEVYNMLDSAADVFGKENIEPVLLIGIDTYEDTMNGLKKLYSKGYGTLTYNVFRIYDYDQMELIHMSFEEIARVIVWIEKHFRKGYKQVVRESKYTRNTYKKIGE